MVWLDAFAGVISKLTVSEGVLLILVILSYPTIVAILMQQMKYRQKEINRLAKENYEYRERFTKILDLEIKYRYDPHGKQSTTERGER